MYNLRIVTGGGDPRGQGSGGMWAAAYQEAEGRRKKALPKVPSGTGRSTVPAGGHTPGAGLAHQRKALMNRKGQVFLYKENRWLPGEGAGVEDGSQRDTPTPPLPIPATLQG